MPKFVILIHDADEDAWEGWTDEQKQEVYDTDEEFGRLLAERGGRVTGGAELSHSRDARVVRRDRTVTDGPFTESVEVLNGFYIVDSPDLETLLELSEVLTRVHDVVEVRPTPSGD
jgi:hypothetical protein